MKLTATDWIVIARSSVPGHWHYAAHWSGDMLAKASDANQIIAMHTVGMVVVASYDMARGVWTA